MLKIIISPLPKVSNLGSGRPVVRKPVTPEVFNEAVFILNNNQKTLEEGITAFAGGGQTNAVVLLNINSIISVVATSADSVKLSSFVEGSEISIINNGVNSLSIFPPIGGDLGAGTNASVSLVVGGVITFLRLATANTFKQTILGGNAVANAPTITEGITAFAGGGQGSAVVVSSETNIISIVVTAADSIKFSTAYAAGVRVTIINTSGNSLDLFPPVGGDIGAGVNASQSVIPGAPKTYVKLSTAGNFQLAV